MKHAITSLCTAAMISMMAVPALADFKRIKTEAEYRKLIAGKKLVTDIGWVMASKNGKLSGNLNGEKLVGAWNWQQGFICLNARIGSATQISECQVVEVDGQTTRVTTKQGKGPTRDYIISR